MVHLGSRPKGCERAQERLLNDVISTPVGSKTPRQRMKLAPIPRDDRRKRPIVACAREADQPLI
jgi:hypothetical protein